MSKAQISLCILYLISPLNKIHVALKCGQIYPSCIEVCSLGLWYVKSCILPVVNAVSMILVVIRAQYQTTFIFLFYTVIFERVKERCSLRKQWFGYIVHRKDKSYKSRRKLYGTQESWWDDAYGKIEVMV